MAQLQGQIEKRKSAKNPQICCSISQPERSPIQIINLIRKEVGSNSESLMRILAAELRTFLLCYVTLQPCSALHPRDDFFSKSCFWKQYFLANRKSLKIKIRKFCQLSLPGSSYKQTNKHYLTAPPSFCVFFLEPQILQMLTIICDLIILHSSVLFKCIIHL